MGHFYYFLESSERSFSSLIGHLRRISYFTESSIIRPPPSTSDPKRSLLGIPSSAGSLSAHPSSTSPISRTIFPSGLRKASILFFACDLRRLETMDAGILFFDAFRMKPIVLAMLGWQNLMSFMASPSRFQQRLGRWRGEWPLQAHPYALGSQRQRHYRC